MMKSLFARITFLSLSLFAAAASAKPYQPPVGIKAEFQAQGSKRYESAAAIINYKRNTMEVVLQPVCRPEDGCDANEPATATYTFESVKSTKDSCGVVTTVGVMDYIPVDGTRTQVTVTDPSNYKCRGLKLAAATLDFEQKWYDRINGKWVRIRDRFKSDSVEAIVVYQAVLRAELQSVASEAYSKGSLFFDGRKGLVELTLTTTGDEPVEEVLTLDNAYTTVNNCGIIQTVASYDNRPVDGAAVKVTINNNGNNTCMTLLPLNALDVIIEKSQYSRLDGKLVSTSVILKADEFTMIKPK